MRDPFSSSSRFDFEAFKSAIPPAVRMLDNVLDLSTWPLEQQQKEALAKRRIGLGFTGLGSTLIMLGLEYDSEHGREMAALIAETLRDAAYQASIDLAKERGPFPLFDKKQYLQGEFVRRLPRTLREQIGKHGIRNSHLLSLAPTGSISLAFAENASGGIEPAFAWTYNRTVQQPDGSKSVFPVEEFAHRLYRERGGDVKKLPRYFRSASEISPIDHLQMVAVVAPFIDSAISKTINVAEDFPYEEFKRIYVDAWKLGLKGVTTFRPNVITGSVLSLPGAEKKTVQPQDLDESDPDRRVRLDKVPTPALASLRSPSRPKFTNGNPAHTYMVEHPNGTSFALFIGHIDEGESGAWPFEVWVNGAEQPRGLGALAKTLSADMRSNDRGWLQMKLESLTQVHVHGEEFELPMSPQEEAIYRPSLISAMATLIKHRCDELGAFREIGKTPLLDALMSRKEPKSGPDGTMSWTVDIINPTTGDDFVMTLKELVMPDGTRRPYSVWLSGAYPRHWDGLCKLLSLDMRVMDPAWIALKLRKLLSYSESQGDFWAMTPGTRKQQVWPSTIAYMARLMVHRYTMLGILDEDGLPIESLGMMASEEAPNNVLKFRSVGAAQVKGLESCSECGSYAMTKRDGCLFCTSCGAPGSCG